MIEEFQIPPKWINPFPYGWPYLTGNVFASICRLVMNYGEPGAFNPQSPTPWCFCKIDHVWLFLRSLNPSNPIVLITANGGHAVTDEVAESILGRYNIKKWFTTNPATRHPGVASIPLGLGNEGSEDAEIGNTESTWTMRAVQDMGLSKDRLKLAAFNMATNPDERGKCAKVIGGVDEERLPYPEFLQKLARSMFCIAPSGTGIDTHRTWEALYLKSVPVVTRSRLWEEHADFPAIVL